MQNTDQQKKYVLKTILTDFSCKGKAITRYTKMAGITQNKQKALFSLWSLNKSSKNVQMSRGKKIVILIKLMIVTKLIVITIK